MKLQLQSKPNPNSPDVGDCYRTCYASIIGWDKEKVPHFSKNLINEDMPLINRRIKEFNRKHGFRRLSFFFLASGNTESLEGFCQFLDGNAPGIPAIVHVSLPESDMYNHTLIAHHGKIIWDPMCGSPKDMDHYGYPHMPDFPDPLWLMDMILKAVDPNEPMERLINLATIL